ISNSGKRAAPNERRLLKLGFEAGSWDHFVSSGEVAWRSFHDMAALEAARDDAIEVAIIVTPNHLHFEPCKAFLEAGIPVICEKPLVHSSQQARELQRIAAANDTFFAVT
ncbi:Gfo/Idh/MocA family oxidoreductase, partial [Mesorhizobium sp. M2D.F.Ca.ET.178.01.1.1]|uniref:Gfo/Idh/MocA family protein n=1 Tax=Mesorhizobium sp. M2D.F.Ca.ET.178.01.1.1 TaxID=2563937 RepID=UPI001FDEEB81